MSRVTFLHTSTTEPNRFWHLTLITPDFPIVEWTLILQELGVLVWNNTAQLKDVWTS